MKKCMHNYISLQDQFTIFDKYNFIKIPKYLLSQAIELRNQLNNTIQPTYLLHADLHCRNILPYKDNYIAIDPWPCIGTLSYEATTFLSSPTDYLLLQDNVHTIMQHRLNRLSHELQINKQELKNYAFI